MAEHSTAATSAVRPDEPARQVANVGRELEYVEQILGPMTNGTAALRCAAPGALLGMLIGWTFGLNWIEPWTCALVLAGYGVALGAIVGAVFGLLVHALQGDQRDFRASDY